MMLKDSSTFIPSKFKKNRHLSKLTRDIKKKVAKPDEVLLDEDSSSEFCINLLFCSNSRVTLSRPSMLA